MSGKVMRRTSRRSPQRLQFARQRVGPLRDVAGAETDHEVALLRRPGDDPSQVGGIRQWYHFTMAVRTQSEDEVVPIDALYRRLARWIDFGNNDGVGVVEAGAKFLKER